MIKRTNRSTTLLIDAAGYAVFAAMLIGAGALSFAGSGESSKRIAETRNFIESTEGALRAMETELMDLEHNLGERRATGDRAMALPEQPSTESFFQSLSSLAAEHELRVLRQSPLATQRYPGIVERQFAFELAGAVPHVAAFLRAFEARDDWADIGYIDLGGAVTGSDAARGDRSAALTVSLYAAAKEAPVEKEKSSGTSVPRRSGT